MSEAHDPYDDEESGSPFDLKVLVLYGAIRSRWVVVACTALGTLGGLFFAAGMPNLYKSSAFLQYKPGALEERNTDDRLGLEDSIQTIPGLEDEIMLLHDRQVYRKVAEQLTPSVVLHVPDPTAGDSASTPLKGVAMHQLQKALLDLKYGDRVIDDQSEMSQRLAAKHLQGNTQVGAAKRSYVIQCTHEAYTPEDAQRNLDAIVEAFVERHNEFYAPMSATLEGRLDDQKQILRKKRSDYQGHKQSVCDIHDLQETLKMGTADDIACKRRIHELRARIADHEKRVEQLEVSLEELDEFHEVFEDQMIENPKWTLANEQYLQAVLEIDKLVSFSGLDRERVRLESEWTKKRDAALLRRDSLEQRVPYGEPAPRLVPNEAWTQLTQQLGETRAALEGYHAELPIELEREKEIEKLLRQAHDCEALHFEYDADIADLSSEVERLRGRYSDELKMEETRQEGESNLKIMKAATLPIEKSGPQRMKLLAAGIGGGMFLGLFLAVLRQFLDRRIRYRETVERLLEAPVLAVVPETRALRHLRSDVAEGA